MKLPKILAEKKPEIVARWFYLVVNTYPADTAKFLIQENDPFANPVGQALREGLEGLYEGWLKGASEKELYPYMDRIVRIRAVQDFSPGEAIGFVLLLKEALRQELKPEIGEGRVSWEDLEFTYSLVDRLLLLAFDVYTRCREELHEIRVKEIKNQVQKLWERVNKGTY
ncbi:RsbT co-antagonist protein rsbRD N-terminal domain-containing protein [Thermanaeromonas toyohensis ToBE]|uniref:RsbT co-antagonist protein rsbRD N-terminal domain-containing protein n=1 Tax=Thermanaeromonas toyohensis ToBE TaxID=698762 RepID=A0A1W1VZL5_9FIRM|nr:RsbRD N-terminal domain-containing protein [Thermanaeromonas toyohensis]SMB98786.1 RsbT co-antagonist protein rsbRD N-terminal domain-containing protein [Thermanaeromonas toyohensis ToBE]